MTHRGILPLPLSVAIIRFLSAVLGWTFAVSAGAAAELPDQAIKVTGTLKELRLKDNRLKSVEFEMLVRKGGWLIKYGKDADIPQYLSTQIGWDGKDFYTLNYADRKAFGEAGAAKDFVAVNGTVRPGRIPDFDHFGTAKLWFAYYLPLDSASYRDAVPCAVIYPPGSPDDLLKANIISADNGSTIESCTIWADSTAKLSTGQIVKLEPPYQNGYKLAEFKVLENMEVAGRKIPKRFTFDVFYMADHPHAATDLKTIYHLTCDVHDARLAETGFLPPKITERTHVVDFRVPDRLGINNIRYFTTSQWAQPGTQFDAAVQEEVKISKMKPVLPTPDNPVRYAAIIGLLALPVAFYSAIQIFLLVRKQPTHK